MVPIESMAEDCCDPYALVTTQVYDPSSSRCTLLIVSDVLVAVICRPSDTIATPPNIQLTLCSTGLL